MSRVIVGALAGVLVLGMFIVLPDNSLTQIEGYNATQVASTNTQIRLSQGRETVLALTPTPTPFSPPQTCNPPTRSDCIVIIVQEGDTPIGVYHRAYPGCPFDLVGFTNLFTINDYQVVYHDDDKIPDFDIGAGDRIVVVPTGAQYVDWNIDNCR